MRDFQTFAPFTKIATQADGTILAHSLVHDETPDDQGESIDYFGGKAAIDDFMKWGAVREMHGETAAGVVDTVIHHDDARYSEAVLHVVDPVAVQKVLTGVYKGTSWGGYKGRDRELAKIGGHDVVRLKAPTFIELSLVDRPSRPTAVLTLMKRADPGPVTEGVPGMAKATATAPAAAVSREKTTTPPAKEPLAKAAADDLVSSHMIEEQIARLIEDESGEDNADSAQVNKLKAALAAMQEFDGLESGELGSTADTAEAAAEEADEEAEMDAIDAGGGTTVILAASAKPGDLRKVGARNAANDQAALDQILALAIQLGAQMPPEQTATGDGTAPAQPAVGAAVAKVAGGEPGTFADGLIDRLAKAGGFVRPADLVAMKDEIIGALGPDLAKIAAQPAPGGPLRHAMDPRGIFGQPAGSAQASSVDDVLAKISNPGEREAVGLLLATQGIKAAHGG